MPRAAENAAAESICRPSDDARIDDSGESVGEACVGAREGERVEFVSTAWGMRFKRPRAAGDDRRACVAAREASAVWLAWPKKRRECRSNLSSVSSCASSCTTCSITSSKREIAQVSGLSTEALLAAASNVLRDEFSNACECSTAHDTAGQASSKSSWFSCPASASPSSDSLT